MKKIVFDTYIKIMKSFVPLLISVINIIGSSIYFTIVKDQIPNNSTYNFYLSNILYEYNKYVIYILLGFALWILVFYLIYKYIIFNYETGITLVYLVKVKSRAKLFISTILGIFLAVITTMLINALLTTEIFVIITRIFNKDLVTMLISICIQLLWHSLFVVLLGFFISIFFLDNEKFIIVFSLMFVIFGPLTAVYVIDYIPGLGDLVKMESNLLPFMYDRVFDIKSIKYSLMVKGDQLRYFASIKEQMDIDLNLIVTQSNTASIWTLLKGIGTIIILEVTMAYLAIRRIKRLDIA